MNLSPAVMFCCQTCPYILAIGEAHVAAGMNNQAWFYRIGPPAEVGGLSLQIIPFIPTSSTTF